MSKTVRTDKLKNLTKVASALAKNPLASEREIASDVGLGNGTVHRAMDNLEQSGAKSKFVLDVLEKDKAIIQRGLEIIQDKLNDAVLVSKMKPSEVSAVIKENTARYSLFAGQATDNEGGLKAGVIVLPSLDMNGSGQTDTMEA